MARPWAWAWVGLAGGGAGRRCRGVPEQGTAHRVSMEREELMWRMRDAVEARGRPMPPLPHSPCRPQLLHSLCRHMPQLL